MKKHTLSVSISFALASTFAVAQDSQNFDEVDVERLVVVSSRTATPIREIATSVSVIDKDDIDARGFANLADVLRVEPSIYVDSNGGAGTPTALRIRGEEAYRTLVRIDGVDISDPTGPQVQPQLAHLQSANVQRVEILRGPQGLAYGADAGGVINVTSGYTSEELAGSVSAETGRFDTQNYSADVGGANDVVDFFVGVSHYTTQGFNSRTDDLSGEADGYDNTTFHGRVGVQATDNLKFNLVVRNTDGEGEYDSCFTASFSSSNDCTNDFEQQNIRVSADYQLKSGQHSLAYATTDMEREFFTEGASTFLSEGKLERAEYLGETHITTRYRVVYGVDWEKESIETSNQARIQQGYYAELQGEVADNLFITAGARHDKNDDFGNHTSYRVSGAYLIPVSLGEVKVRTAYGTGFRAPSLFEVDYNQGPFAFAPASETRLKEETSEGYEAAVSFTQKNGDHYEVVYFNQDVEDAIFFDLAGFSGYLQDAGQSSSKGVEVIANVSLGDNWGIDANATYNDTTDAAGTTRLRRPRYLANVGVFYQLNQLKVATYVRAVDGVKDGVELDSYELVDVSVRYQINDNAEVFARVENLFDTDYQQISAFNTSGMAAHAGVKYQF